MVTSTICSLIVQFGPCRTHPAAEAKVIVTSEELEVQTSTSSTAMLKVPLSKISMVAMGNEAKTRFVPGKC